MAKSKKVSFLMDASQALKARDFLAFALSKRAPEDWSKQKTAARKMLEQLEVALRTELGPESKRTKSVRPPAKVAKKPAARKPAKKAVKKVAKKPTRKTRK